LSVTREEVDLMHDTIGLVTQHRRILALGREHVRSLAEDLSRRGISVSVAVSEEALMRGLADGFPHAVLLAGDGEANRPAAEAVRRVRGLSRIPCVVVASPGDRIEDRIAALEAGADEVLHVGIPQIEAIARIRAVLRRVAPDPVAAWRLAPAGRRLTPLTGETLRLTGAEYEFLLMLAAADGAAVDRETLCVGVFRRPWRPEDRAVDSLVRRLRRKLPIDAISSVRNVGYALVVPIEITEARV
jgi:DNA-binding response OmpR family regulator